MTFPHHGVTQGALLQALAREAPERCAIEFPELGVAWTFGMLEERSRRLARGLLALGVERGGRVAVWASNSPEWIAFQFAIARIGAVLVTANPQLAPPEIAYLLKQNRTSVLVAERELIARFTLPPGVLHVIAIDGDAPLAMSVEDLVRNGDTLPAGSLAARAAKTHPDDAANIQYTSGTTGRPKGVVLTHRNIVENAYAMSRLLGVQAGERLLLMVPLFHCFGCVIVVLGAFTHAATIVGFAKFDPGAILSAGGFDLVYGVPTMFRALMDHEVFREPDRFGVTLPRPRAGIMAGAPCPEPLMHRAIGEWGCAGLVVAYGLTEASPSCTSSRPTDPVDVRCVTAGRAIEGVEVRAVDPDTRTAVAAGIAGEIEVRGPNVMQGYFDDVAATQAVISRDGWLRTGDLGTIDATGLVRIVGRIKEMIKRGGENVYPAEVEDAIRAHPAVADAAVFGVPHDYWGEEVAAAVIRRSGAALEAEELASFLEPRLAKFKCPTRVTFVVSFPTTASGKVQKFKLAAT